MLAGSSDGKNLIARRHPEWREHQLRWRWLLDSLEGGERYRQAIYGRSRKGLPIRNLIPHKREYPDPRDLPGASGQYGSAVYLAGIAQGMAGGGGGIATAFDQAQFAEDSDYELRRARTPVPTFVAESVDAYLSKIFSAEVDRDAPEGPLYDPLRAAWADIDGLGTSVDQWIEDTIGPLLLTFGQIDLCFDHPAAPDGTLIATEADALRAGIKKCVAGYILPFNVVWWRLAPDGRYAEVLVLERPDGAEESAGTGIGPNAAAVATEVRYRHWTPTGSTLYDVDGRAEPTIPHSFGEVPIRRFFLRRKARCRNVGLSLLEAIAERNREYYNRDSELILSDTTQAHPLLQGPEDWIKEDGTIPIGPSNLLPMKKNGTSAAASYQGFSVVDFPKGAADSLRQNKADIRNDVDRDAKLMKPAGTSGTNGTTVAQSGVSKGYDHEGLHARLAKVAKALARVETGAALMILTVLSDGKPPADAADVVKISYPTVFSLYAADELAAIAVDFQGILSAAGEAPEVEAAILCEIVRKALPGRDDDTYADFDTEIEATVQRKAKELEQRAESMVAAAAASPTGQLQPGSGLAHVSKLPNSEADDAARETPETGDYGDE